MEYNKLATVKCRERLTIIRGTTRHTIFRGIYLLDTLKDLSARSSETMSTKA